MSAGAVPVLEHVRVAVDDHSGYRTDTRKRDASRPAELLHMILEQPLDLAVDGKKAAIEIEEALPLRVAIADRERVRPTIERIARIDHMRPAFVALGEQDHVNVAADPHVGLLGADRLGAERDLAGR